MTTRDVIIDSLDTPNNPNERMPDQDSATGPTRSKPARTIWFRIALLGALVLLGTCSLLSVSFLQWLMGASAPSAFIDPYLIAALKIALSFGPIAAVLLALYWTLEAIRNAGIVYTVNNMPLTRKQVQSLEWFSLLDRSVYEHYQVQARWAEASRTRNINHVSSDMAAPLLAPDTDSDAITIPAPSEWLQWLNRTPHIMLCAQTGGGKSTLAKAILSTRIAAGELVYIIDPHSSDWLGLPSIGGGENWGAVSQAMASIIDEYRLRLEYRDTYKAEQNRELSHTHFTRITVLLDEANNTEAALNDGRGNIWEQFVSVLGSGARKVNISVLLLCQSANVADLGISGGMRQNFSRIALDMRTIRIMINGDEMDAQRRRELAALLPGMQYPATMEYQNQVYLLSRDGLALEYPPADDTAVWVSPVRSFVRSENGHSDAEYAPTARTNVDTLVDAMLERAKYTRASLRADGLSFTDQEYTQARKAIEKLGENSR